VNFQKLQMNNTISTPISGYEQLKRLRTALAVAQGTLLLPTFVRESEYTVSHDQTKRVTYLTGLFSRIHRELFQDWKEQATVNHRPGTMTDPEKRKQFRIAIESLVLDDDSLGGGNKKTAIFDNNGFVFATENISARLAFFYRTMRRVRPFSYGNRITLDFFMTALGKLPAFKGVYEQGIDFRRLAASDAVVLHDLESSLEEITTAFQHALDPARSKSLQNKPNAYGKWPENKKFISGIPFLSHRTEDGRECLVSVNGGLVPIDSIKEELFLAGKHLADYPMSAPDNIIGYLPGTEELRQPGKNEIDGIGIAEDGAAPLFCLDINMLTGLRSPSHAELLDLLAQCEGDDKNLIFNLANNDRLKGKLLLAAAGDSRLQRSVEIACDRLSKVMQRLENTAAAIFEGKTPESNPKLFLCMGGAGSGKTAVEEMAKAQCGNNFVVASLDEFRKQSDLYKVLTAANHHSDDYVYVEPFANRLRDLVANQARELDINILYDGTSIPYSPRYSGIVSQFKKAGFHTQITAVDAFLVKPKGREAELSRSGVIGSVKERFEKTGRALPWVITTYKHIRVSESFLIAAQDYALDKISLFANDGAFDRHYLVAEFFAFSDQDVRTIQERQRSETLAEHLKSLIRTHDDSVLRKLTKVKEGGIEALIARNPDFSEKNVAYQIYPSKSGNRVLLIYNTSRMVDFVEKRQLNPNASGEEGLLHKSAVLAFAVDPLAGEPWLTRLQGSAAG
jgi:Zeta toxin